MGSNQPHYLTALYMRLSKDDDRSSESASIVTQRKLLRSFARENDFMIYDEYVDDGWSGTNFQRPDFKRMIQDIEHNKVNLVITKDLSRLGRDYITAGQFTEIYFPSKDVRYIAINDGYDSLNPHNDIVPFKNLLNEMYARDTSKKIRSAFMTKMKEGSYIGSFAPYGYKKDDTNKNRLVIDNAVSPIVERIFDMASQGSKPSEIANYLNSKNVPTPMIYRCQQHPHLNPDDFQKRREWTSSTVVKILRNTVYIGNTSQGKTSKISFKSTLTAATPRESWITVDNTHEAIISKETFDIVRRHSQSRTCPQKGNFTNIFSGIAKCADCGKNMSSVGSRKKSSSINLACGSYKLYGSAQCSNHFIDYKTLYSLVLKSLQEQLFLTETEENQLISALQKDLKNNHNDHHHNGEMKKLTRRKGELDGIIEKLYEDHYQGVINNERFKKLLDRYEIENTAVTDKITFLSESAPQKEDLKQSYEQLLDLIREWTEIQRLTPDFLFKFIDHIEIEQGFYEKTETGKIKHQKIKIYFRFIGKDIARAYSEQTNEIRELTPVTVMD